MLFSSIIFHHIFVENQSLLNKSINYTCNSFFMNGSSKINSYLMPANCTVSYHSVGFVVPGDSTYNQLQIKLIMIWSLLSLCKVLFTYSTIKKIFFRKCWLKNYRWKEPNSDNPFFRQLKSYSVRIRMHRPL